MKRGTLLTDGSSDTVLVPILAWLMSRLTPVPWDIRWADLRGLPNPPKKLDERIVASVELYPCDLLFVHRDAERDPADVRRQEIGVANRPAHPYVPVIPVRMQEAWLLHDEVALREAAGRPSGREPLSLPPLHRLEQIPDPKQTLHEALLMASGLKGRRLKQFRPSVAAHRLAELITDWSPLRELSAFQRLEEDTTHALSSLGLPLHRFAR